MSIDPRVAHMVKAFISGQTLQSIGDEWGLTRQRVQQLLSQQGLTSKDGGLVKRVERKTKLKSYCAYWLSMKRYGMSPEEVRAIKNLPKAPFDAFRFQKRNAHTRGIVWNLNFKQWWMIWQLSGKWEQRGRGSGYVMCRKNDSGAYVIGNVYIDTARHNHSVVRGIIRKLPMGVRLRPSGKFAAVISIRGNHRGLGTYNTAEEANRVYEKHVRKSMLTHRSE